ncbi:MAG: AAA family ATPase [Patescibacteria group bacterium]
MNKSLEDIARDFKSQIFLPEQKLQKQAFFCPVGLVGSGKTTITKPISDSLGLVRISSDELRKILKENGYAYDPVKDIVFNIAGDFAKQKYSISFDMDCGNPEVKEFVDILVQKLKAEAFWVYVNTPEAYIFEKFRKHPPSWLSDNPETMINNYRIQKEKRLKENISFNFSFTFDASRPDLKDQINECIKLINAKSVG